MKNCGNIVGQLYVLDLGIQQSKDSYKFESLIVDLSEFDTYL